MVVCRTLDYIANPDLHKFLTSKFNKVKETGIEIEIELTERINDLNMDFMDLSRIIEIFLDNAVEAAMETEEKEVFFCMFYKENDLYLIIINTTLPLTCAVSMLRNSGALSKSERRGSGLYNVDMILRNYENTIWNTTYEEPYFTQQLILIHND